MKKQLLLVFAIMTFAPVLQAQTMFSAMWWNVENFFDLIDDPHTNDDEFTPQGERHWTRRRFNAKRDGVYKTIVRAGLPTVVGLAEVENAYVLRELCQATPLAKQGYRYLHYNSPDHRGIDCALLYRSSQFQVLDSKPVRVSDTAEGFYTRDILLVVGVTSWGDSVALLLNHWPSRRGGDQAMQQRMRIAQRLNSLMDSLHHEYPTAAVLAMGDMNAAATDPSIALGMGFGNGHTNAQGVENLNHRLPSYLGTYRYQGVWEYLDAMFLLANPEWKVESYRVRADKQLLVHESNHLGKRPYRTYRGPVYEGGVSDHLPLLLKLSYSKQSS